MVYVISSAFVLLSSYYAFSPQIDSYVSRQKKIAALKALHNELAWPNLRVTEETFSTRKKIITEAIDNKGIHPDDVHAADGLIYPYHDNEGKKIYKPIYYEAAIRNDLEFAAYLLGKRKELQGCELKALTEEEFSDVLFHVGTTKMAQIFIDTKQVKKTSRDYQGDTLVRSILERRRGLELISMYAQAGININILDTDRTGWSTLSMLADNANYSNSKHDDVKTLINVLVQFGASIDQTITKNGYFYYSGHNTVSLLEKKKKLAQFDDCFSKFAYFESALKEAIDKRRIAITDLLRKSTSLCPDTANLALAYYEPTWDELKNVTLPE